MKAQRVNHSFEKAIGAAVVKDQRIVALSFFWMFCIVLFHCGGSVGATWYRELISDFRVGGVSFFFVVSGYFFVKNIERSPLWAWWWSEIRKRFRTLVIPYFLWCLLGLTGFDLLRQFGLVGIVPTANPPLWYIKFLFLFCLLSPVMVVGIRFLRKSGILLIVLLLAFCFLPWLALPLKFCLWNSLVMFIIGMALGLDGRKNLLLRRTQWTLGLLAIWIALYVYRVCWGGWHCAVWPVRVWSACILVVVSWLIVSYVDFRRELPPVLRVAFFVYCFHALMMRLCVLFDGASVVGAFANGVLIFCGSCAVAMIVSRVCRFLYIGLTGGRP